MKKTWLLILFFCFGLFPALCLAEVPRSLAGFTLGTSIEGLADKVEMDSALRIRYMPYMEEVKTRSIPGFKSGLIYYGTCVNPGRIVRIKLKYMDSSERFFKQLLKRYKAKFGDPDEYRGDPFHILIAWKWSFTDKDNNRISLILQHNTQNIDQKMGNAVKMTVTSMIEEEQRCFAKKHPHLDLEKTPQKKGPVKVKPDDWKRFIPE
jgi:hypothetical protein